MLLACRATTTCRADQACDLLTAVSQAVNRPRPPNRAVRAAGDTKLCNSGRRALFRYQPSRPALPNMASRTSSRSTVTP